ncbi:hypothetical protein VM1G_09225 [Cytospora mali]|uniref:DDHD domain-containing protein n=1 Tax=Cytospora mali TaxID=578113 RepID=A0A194WBU2_CYTMA|nr:hypothetical protein VM1G_09225 [Valsa mali]
METASVHTYGQNCRLAPVVEPKPDDALLDGIPSINAQFFYHSLIPIDDPLSTATVTTAPDAKATKGILRPFSQADNNALERAWLSLTSEDDRNNHEAALKNTKPDTSLVIKNSRKLDAIIAELVRRHREKHASEARTAPLEPPQGSLANTDLAVCCQELLIDATNSLREAFCEISRRKQRLLNQEYVIAKVMSVLERDRPTAMVTAPIMAPAVSTSSPRIESFVSSGLSTSVRGRASSLASNPPDSRSASIGSRAKQATLGTSPQLEKYTSKLSNTILPGHTTSIPARPPVVEDGISGKPFLRVGDPDTGTPLNIAGPSQDSHPSAPQDRVTIEHTVDGEDSQADATGATLDGNSYAEIKSRVVEVPVGVSRLHEVSLPVLQMKPIYWSPVNDIAIVSRATWFFKDTMVPVEPAVANQLEAGYRELRAFSQEWQEELRCAVEVGPLGEEKVSYPLWSQPVSLPAARNEDDEIAEPPISSDPFCAARCFHGEASAEGTLEPVQAGPTESPNGEASARGFAAYHVIYRDAKIAFLLKPSLKPSAYYSRKPLQKIMKGLTVGVPVVRGFDRDSWDKLHEKKKRPSIMKGSRDFASSADAMGATSPENCLECGAERASGHITDLVLVAHGIGQKFAERVESFHFTHAITAFRRSVQLQVRDGSVRSVLREGHNGIMVLPVNWRHHLSLEDGGPMTDADKADSATESFGLKDIEPNTIPAVRSLISDVMFDIPFYMSHHKPKMISALVAEANRVYRLWCRNNPHFACEGRVHLIAHSLGSVMTLEVLSRQPSIPPPLDLSKTEPETQFFEFDTTNLFLLGSPAGFFLLLERGSLVPRRGRRKPGAEPSDTVANDVVGEPGAFGCLAVDNIYNILAKEDPIAYLLNGTIDPLYAETLKTAYVPSTTTSWLQRWIPVGTAASELPVQARPPTTRLPSQLELEVHDFTREEVAERKAFLLNDNGQVDYYLRSGSGPLELQYVNMLSAHTSYWTNHDLVRLLCMEIGREPGRANTLPALRAVKLTRRDRLGT